MDLQVDTKDAKSVQAEVQSIYEQIFPDSNSTYSSPNSHSNSASTFVSDAFDWTLRCFRGRYRGFKAIDARYHDLEHTMQGTLCMMRLLQGYHQAGRGPFLEKRVFELGLLAILLHDTGYLKKKEDYEGTGAKYTLIHVNRSLDFAAQLLAEKKFSPAEILAVQNMIRCTGVNVDLNTIPFQHELERIVGFALGTADLLGQMAADDYVDKLPVLYEEFAESQTLNTGMASSKMMFTSALDLMRKTPIFWNKYVRLKIEHDFRGLYRYLNVPFPDGPNPYIDRIESNIHRLEQQLRSAS